MAKSYTVFGFRGETGNFAKASVRGITTEVAAATFRAFLQNHSESVIQTQSYSARTVIDDAPDAGSDTDNRLVCRFQEVDTGDIVRVTVVDPLAADYESIPGKDGGQRATEAFMTLLNAALSAATGLDYRSLEGIFYHKK